MHPQTNLHIHIHNSFIYNGPKHNYQLMNTDYLPIKCEETPINVKALITLKNIRLSKRIWLQKMAQSIIPPV